jgi:hypothetical protein
MAFTAYITFEVWLFNKVRPASGPGLIFPLTFFLAVLFWWFSAYMLLFREVPLRRLLPAGVATGFCITGLGVFSSLIFSGQITDGQKSYGPARVVIARISFLVGFGVCLHAGAVFGRMWSDWQDERVAHDKKQLNRGRLYCKTHAPANASTSPSIDEPGRDVCMRVSEGEAELDATQ